MATASAIQPSRRNARNDFERGGVMSSSSVDLHVDLDRTKIAAVRQQWLEAVKTSDADKLAELVTHDVVGVHTNGRCTVGKENLKTFFLGAFDRFNFEGKITSSEIAVHGIWAVEIDEVETRRTQFETEISTEGHYRTVFVFCRQLDDSWQISRVIELED